MRADSYCLIVVSASSREYGILSRNAVRLTSPRTLKRVQAQRGDPRSLLLGALTDGVGTHAANPTPLLEADGCGDRVHGQCSGLSRSVMAGISCSFMCFLSWLR